jgi:hypothetical protein
VTNRVNPVHGAVIVPGTCGGSAGGLSADGFQPVRSRWTWQPSLPQLWLQTHEGRFSRLLFAKQKRED